MKKVISVLLILSVFLCMFCGCNRQTKYGGTDANGDTAADVVKRYYKALEKGEDTQFFFSETYKERDVVKEVFHLKELSFCEVVEEPAIRESDKEWLAELEEEYYAYCFVQTSDSIVCNEDGSEGMKVEEVQRYYSYTLVMEDSVWKIYDFGYPPHYEIEE